MTSQSPKFSKALFEELTRDPDVLSKQVGAQVEQLLYKPLLALKGSRVPVVFVIDALDECGGQPGTNDASDDAEIHHTISEMLEALVAFSRSQAKLTVKFLVTSRPETHIRDTHVSDTAFSTILRLHTVNKEQVTKDIRLYVATRLSSSPQLRVRFTADDADMLAQLCDGLFIVATTALQYALGTGIDAAAMKFKTLLNASHDSLSVNVAAPLDRMYAVVLSGSARIDGPEMDELPERLRLLAAILCARMPLSITALADLLGIPDNQLRASLSKLHAVVHVPEDDSEPGLRTVHASFGDYLYGRAASNVRISALFGHDILARGCLRRFAQGDLCFNVSQSHSSFQPNLSETLYKLPQPHGDSQQLVVFIGMNRSLDAFANSHLISEVSLSESQWEWLTKEESPQLALPSLNTLCVVLSTCIDAHMHAGVLWQRCNSRQRYGLSVDSPFLALRKVCIAAVHDTAAFPFADSCRHVATTNVLPIPGAHSPCPYFVTCRLSLYDVSEFLLYLLADNQRLESLRLIGVTDIVDADLDIAWSSVMELTSHFDFDLPEAMPLEQSGRFELGHWLSEAYPALDCSDTLISDYQLRLN